MMICLFTPGHNSMSEYRNTRNSVTIKKAHSYILLLPVHSTITSYVDVLKYD